MATITLITGTEATLSSTALNSLNDDTYVSAGTINHTTNDPLDVLITVEFGGPATPAGGKQVVVFAQGSLDGTDFESGPTSGTTTTNEPDLTFIGTVPCNDTNTHRGMFSLAAAFGGVLPQQTKIICKNDTGGTLDSSGGAVYYSEVTGDST